MLEGFDFGSPSIAPHLIGKLSALSKYNGLKIPADYFFEAMDRLRNKYLNVPSSSVLHPASPAAASASVEQKEAASAAPLVKSKELTAQEWFERGYSATEPSEQIRCYFEAIRLKPDFAEAFYNRSIARGLVSDFSGSIADSSEAIRLKTDYADAFVARGVSRQKGGDFEGAILDFSEAIRLNPDYALAFGNRGDARHGKGDFGGAIADCSEAIRLKPDFASAFNSRGLARRASGDEAGALEDFEAARNLRFKGED
jgi:tetratricopeptide (TPR) repeat protein